MTSINQRNEDHEWRDAAACLNADPDLFFPIGSNGAVQAQIRAVKAVCEGCPVKERCLQFALETNQEAGVWGGLEENERRAVRRIWSANRRASLVSQ